MFRQLLKPSLSALRPQLLRLSHAKQQIRAQKLWDVQPMIKYSFCSVPEQSPLVLKNSIKLGHDASEGQQVQKNLQEQFYLIESISNPEHSHKHKKIIQDFYFDEEFLNCQQLADCISIDENKLLQKLTSMGLNPDKILLKEANVIALEYDVKIQSKKDKRTLKLRPPVVTIMGHVDHGKTTLLDYLRNSQIAKGEFGGITQKIGAFHVITSEGQHISFIDTPGHEAFSNMRVRGANSTDIIILVVSAIEGIQPQTLEVIKLAYQNEVPLIVAINKIDVNGARPELIEQQLHEQGKLNLETFGGNIPVIHISAKNGTNMDLLQELILFEAELMELKEEYDTLAEGIVIESRRDEENDEKSCTVIIQKGTLKIGDNVIIGNNYCKIRSMKDDKKTILKQAFPSFAVEITGIKELPQSGDVIFALDTENHAKIISARRIKNEEELNIQEEEFIEGAGSKLKFENRRERRKFFSGNRDIMEAKYSEVETRILEKIKELEEQECKGEKEKQQQEVAIQKLKASLHQNKKYMANLVGDLNVGRSINLIIKANDFGTKETLVSQILKAKEEFPETQLNIISANVGQVNEADIRDAELFNAKILGMNIQLSRDIEAQVKQKSISVKSHRIIYTLIDDIKLLLQEGPENNEEEEKVKEEERGQAVIQSVIEIKASKTQTQLVAGCKVLSGKINKKYLFRLERDGEIVEKDLEVANLRHFKKEVEEIKEGNECGLIFFKFNEFEQGDTIIAYEKV